MRTDVTADDIALGVPCLSDRCPVARAMRREHGGTWFVGRTQIQHENEEGAIVARYLTPPEVARFVDDIDEGRGEAKPFTFTLLEAS